MIAVDLWEVDRRELTFFGGILWGLDVVEVYS